MVAPKGRGGESLRGYAYVTHKRDGFVCVYCGLDGKQWPHWLYLSEDHLLPVGHPLRSDRRYVVTACRICNEFANRYKYDVEGKTPEQIVEMKAAVIAARRAEFRAFWETYVSSPE